ncbi:MAG: large subunit ribosomal protein [Patescibacteria group bacterium]|nr:large subunit ribosomal protein [Patescibacteria group bacterium]
MEVTETKKNTKIVKSAKAKAPISMEAVVYSNTGKESKKITLPENVFGLSWNADLVHQVATSLMSSQRTPVAHTKNRGEVSGGGKKPWRQKGTGRARHGSTRSPIWVGGGVTHGPRNDKDYTRKVNKKMKAKALYMILSAKYKKGQIMFVDKLSFTEPKTKEAKNVLVSLSKIDGFNDLVSKKKNSVYITIPAKDMAVERSFSNFNTMFVDEIRNMNPLDLLQYKYLIVANPETGLPQIAGKLEATKKTATK